ncbi:hypothetical protein RIVM261_037290 [Rivularia sp. IAM M-261]|nr:hypothetical protein CAL7716_076290 [Calothrix sp. PCC 7716]GJD18773.1 hypothetical protein RIVM261_037290 [Rivularia sp. IAM M-261]
MEIKYIMLLPKFALFATLLTAIIGSQIFMTTSAKSQASEASITNKTFIINTNKYNKSNVQKLPQSTFRLIQNDIQKRFGVSPNTLKLHASTSETWDGCMGIPKPNGPCTAIAISGFRVVVSNQAQNRFWVYHTSNDGERLAYNSTASLPRNAKISAPKIINRNKIIPTSGDSVIFQAAQTTGFSSEYYAWELTRDGLLTRRAIARKPGKQETIRQLSKQELDKFTDVLTKNSFNHFHRLSYLNMSAIAADAGSYQFNYYGAVVEYTQDDLQKYPANLRRIISEWEKLLVASSK